MTRRSGAAPSAFDGRDLVHVRDGVPGDRTVELPVPFGAHAQGPVPCCVSTAVTGAMEILDATNGGDTTPLSPLFHYWVARGDPRWLGSLTLRAGLQAAVMRGVCRLALHDPPFSREGALAAPSAAADDDADDRKLVGYDPRTRIVQYFALRAFDRVGEWRSCLARGFPIVVGFWATPAYWAMEGNQDDVHGDPTGVTGTDGHAVVVVGYDDGLAGGAFRIRDSRGAGFGTHGSWWLPYDVARSTVVFEAWAARKITY